MSKGETKYFTIAMRMLGVKRERELGLVAHCHPCHSIIVLLLLIPLGHTYSWGKLLSTDVNVSE